MENYKNENVDALSNLKDVLVIGIIGFFNCGKTYILNRLLSYGLPFGYDVHTKGLSATIAFINTFCQIISNSQDAKRTFLLLDSAGKDVPMNTTDAAKMNLTLLAVDFLQQLILNLSEVVIFVTNFMKHSEANFIKHKLEKSKNIKVIVLIHNFNTVDNKEEFETLCRDQIIKPFETNENPLKEPSFITIKGGKKVGKSSHYYVSKWTVPIYHFPIVQEQSIIGKEINDGNFAKIFDLLINHQTSAKINLEEEVEKHLATYLSTRALKFENKLLNIPSLLTFNQNRLCLNKNFHQNK